MSGPGDHFPWRRSRFAVAVLYVVMGYMIGAWGARVPTIREQIGVGAQQWGIINTIAAAGDVVGLGIVIVVVGRVNTRRVALAGAGGVVLAAPLLGFASSPAGIVCGLVIWYLCAQVMATPMGALAMEVQAAYGRPLLSWFNAVFSISLFVGAAISTVVTAVGVGPGVQFTVTNTALGALVLVSMRWLPQESARGGEPGAPRRRIRDRFTAQMRLVAALAFLTGLVASISSQWSALYIADELGAGAIAGGICFALMSAAGIFTLLAGDRLTARYGSGRVLRAGAILAGAALVLALIAERPAMAIAGFVVFAVGIACNNAIIDQIAASQPLLSPSEGLSVSEMGQMPAFFLSPALIGVLAGSFGLRSALSVPVVALVVMATLVTFLRPYQAQSPHR